MSNHARGLWGYTGAARGSELTIQATGMGGPSAAIVLGDLAELGVRRAVRIGTCAALDPQRKPGELLLVVEAHAEGGSGASFGVEPGEGIRPDAELARALERELAEATPAAVASFDALPPPDPEGATGVAAADMQTVAVLARARGLGIAAAAVLIVAESGSEPVLSDQELEQASKRAGTAVREVLSS